MTICETLAEQMPAVARGEARWDPAAPEGVTGEMLDAIFAPFPQGGEWSPFPA